MKILKTPDSEQIGENFKGCHSHPLLIYKASPVFISLKGLNILFCILTYRKHFMSNGQMFITIIICTQSVRKRKTELTFDFAPTMVNKSK